MEAKNADDLRAKEERCQSLLEGQQILEGQSNSAMDEQSKTIKKVESMYMVEKEKVKKLKMQLLEESEKQKYEDRNENLLRQIDELQKVNEQLRNRISISGRDPEERKEERKGGSDINENADSGTEKINDYHGGIESNGNRLKTTVHNIAEERSRKEKHHIRKYKAHYKAGQNQNEILEARILETSKKEKLEEN